MHLCLTVECITSGLHLSVFQLAPPPPWRGTVTWPKSIENTRRQRRQREFLQGAEADLHCDTTVQFCGVIPVPPQGGDGHDIGGEITRGGGYLLSGGEGGAFCWRQQCWVTFAGKLKVNIDLWENLIVDLEKSGREVKQK